MKRIVPRVIEVLKVPRMKEFPMAKAPQSTGPKVRDQTAQCAALCDLIAAIKHKPHKPGEKSNQIQLIIKHSS